jgi:hypothetical protein
MTMQEFLNHYRTLSDQEFIYNPIGPAIRFYHPDLPKFNFCPVTAVCYLLKKLPYQVETFDLAGIELDLTEEDTSDIVDSSDGYSGICYNNQSLREVLINTQVNKIYETK